MAPKELLQFKLWDNVTLRDVLMSHLLEGQFGTDHQNMDEVEMESFFNTISERIIDFVKD